MNFKYTFKEFQFTMKMVKMGVIYIVERSCNAHVDNNKTQVLLCLSPKRRLVYSRMHCLSQLQPVMFASATVLDLAPLGWRTAH